VRDLARWAAFLADPDESILRRDTVEEMRTLQSLADHVRWSAGYGLGLQLVRDGDRILVGHGGSMPGFIAGVYVSPSDKIGVAVLTNSSGARVVPLAQKVLSATVGTWPVPPKPWQVEDSPPADVVPLLGIWFMEGDPIVFRWRDGKLEAQFPDAADWELPAVFRRESDDRWRIISGFEHGEVLRVEAERMVLAGYPVTREPAVWV
jgi:CubicO group peptidase (beta-lactamase class C family)